MRTLTLAAVALAATGAAAAAAAADRPLAIDTAGAAVRWGPCPPIFPSGCQIAVLNGDPARPNADVLLRVPGGMRLRPHRHSSAERMMLVTGRMRVHYQGSAPRLLGPGTYAYGPAGMPHEATCLRGQRCTLFIAFEGPVDATPVAGRIR